MRMDKIGQARAKLLVVIEQSSKEEDYFEFGKELVEYFLLDLDEIGTLCTEFFSELSKETVAEICKGAHASGEDLGQFLFEKSVSIDDIQKILYDKFKEENLLISTTFHIDYRSQCRLPEERPPHIDTRRGDNHLDVHYPHVGIPSVHHIDTPAKINFTTESER